MRTRVASGAGYGALGAATSAAVTPFVLAGVDSNATALNPEQTAVVTAIAMLAGGGIAGAIGGATSAVVASWLVDQAGGSNTLTPGQRAAIVGVSTLLGGVTAGLAGQNAQGGATAAENESLNNATSTKNPSYAAKMLGYDYNTFGDMLHVLKPANGLGPADNVIFHSNGDIEFNGDIIDNIHNYAP